MEALRAAQKAVSEEARRHKDESAKRAHELARAEARAAEAEGEARAARADAETAHAAKVAALEGRSSAPVIDDLGRQLKELDDKRAELAVANANMKVGRLIIDR